ncbi:hypothetical protein EJ110_NYTH37141 [Nymphaea thermarum]|nr:hypothetical protein EJ110_NYTH37141 [Nymphaea thermarum]
MSVEEEMGGEHVYAWIPPDVSANIGFISALPQCRSAALHSHCSHCKSHCRSRERGLRVRGSGEGKEERGTGKMLPLPWG